MGKKSTRQKDRDIINVSYCTSDTYVTKNVIKPKDEYQKKFVEAIKNKDLIFGLGKAGTGKTLLSLYNCVKGLDNEYLPQDKIYYLRSNVGLNDEKDFGHLPGGIDEKLLPLSLPIYDNLSEFLNLHQIDRLFKQKSIQVSPLVYLRGRSLKNSFVILDEAQNCTYKQFKTIVSRLSQNSKLIILGDLEQIDIKKNSSGFAEVIQRLENTDSLKCKELFEIVYFKNNYRNQSFSPLIDIL